MESAAAIFGDHFPRLLDDICDGVILLDRRRIISCANASVARRTGLRQTDLIGKKFWSIFPEKKRVSYTARITHGLRESGRWAARVELLTAGDGPLFADLLVTSAQEGNRMSPSVICILSAFSEGRGNEPKADRLQAEFSLFEPLIDGVAVSDPSGNIEYCNPAYASLLGRDRHTIAGTSFPYPWIDQADRRNYRECLRAAKNGCQTGPFRLTVIRAGGERATVEISLSALAAGLKTRTGCITMMRRSEGTPTGDELRRALEQIHRLGSDVRRKAERLLTLETVNAIVLKSQNRDQVFRSVVAGIKRLVPHDLAGIYVYDSLNNWLVPHTLSKVTPFSRRLAKFPLRLGEGIIGAAAVTGEHVIVNNAHLDPNSRYPRSMKPAIEHFVAVPLRSNTSTFGVLVVSRNSQPEFNEEEALIVQSFASATTMALENARLSWQLEMIRRKYPALFADEPVRSAQKSGAGAAIRQTAVAGGTAGNYPARAPKRALHR